MVNKKNTSQELKRVGTDFGRKLNTFSGVLIGDSIAIAYLYQTLASLLITIIARIGFYK